MDSIILI